MKKMTLDEIKRCASEFRKGLLANRDSDMMCLAVCFPLQGLLACCGVACELVEGEFIGAHHAWIELPDGTVIDPTLDQFNGDLVKFPKVYVGPRLEQYSTTLARTG